MPNVIELEGVSKRYRLGEHHGTGTDLRETLARVGRRLRGLPKPEVREFWSLRDVNFTVEGGTAVGIIGSNGAGKSTLLKVISGITSPTRGVCRTRGRIGSLLEVGTGFHGELTGLENVYLNGAILGMTRREVEARLDAIVDFAGLDGFMDTPVKRYSSGMYLRLGFAVAAHMSAEILLVDEVLAVGDADFQRRCLGKMSEVEHSGRTVVFVSHNMEAVARLCPTSIWLDHGQIRAHGLTSEVIDAYLGSGAVAAAATDIAVSGSPAAHIDAVALVDRDGRPTAAVPAQTVCWVQLDITIDDEVRGLDVSCEVLTHAGVSILDEVYSDRGSPLPGEPGRYRVRCELPPVLTPGDYFISAWMGTPYEQLQVIDRVVRFSVEGDDLGRPRRLVALDAAWTAERLDGIAADG